MRNTIIKRRIAILLALLLALGTLVGCKSTTPPSSGSGTAPSSTTSTPKQEKTVLRVGRTEDVTFWDPLDHFHLGNWTIDKLLYDQLITRHPDGTFTPRLATEWKNSEDKLSWELTLRDDVKFSNGETLDAEDVKFTMERFLTENLRQASNFKNLKSVDIIDPTHIKVNFTEPNGAFLAIISELAILPKDAFEKLGKDTLFANPIGSGPYKFVSWTKGAEIVLDKRDDYWGTPGKSDRIEYKVLTDDTSRVNAFLAGDVDWVDVIPADQLSMFEGKDDVTIDRIQTWDQLMLGIKCDVAPFNDKNVREAISLCIDREAIVKSILEGGTPALWPVAKGVVGYKDYPVPAQDIEKAKELIKSSGYDGRQINFVGPISWYARTNEIMQYIASCLTEIGFNVNIELVDGTTFTQRRGSGDYDIYYTGCAQITGDANLYLGQRVSSYYDSMKSGYKNAELDKKIAEVLAITDANQRKAKMEEIFQIMVSEYAPHIFVYGIENIIANRKVEGVEVFPDKIYDFSQAYVAK